MGRARQLLSATTVAERRDRFVDVFGSGRGRSENDLLSARHPSETARADLGSVVAGLSSEPGLWQALRLLRAQPRPLPFPRRTPQPLLRDLNDAISVPLGAFVWEQWGEVARDYLQLMGVRTRQAHGIVHAPSGTLHLWDEARDSGSVEFALAEFTSGQRLRPTLACGHRIGGPAPGKPWGNADRGAWAAGVIAHCSACEKLLPRVWSDVSAETREHGAPILPGWLARESFSALGQQLLNTIMAAPLAGDLHATLRPATAALMPTALADAAGELLDEQREAVVKRLLTPARYRQLCESKRASEREAGLLGFVFSEDDWADFFTAHAPTGDDLVVPSPQTVSADFERRLRARLQPA